MEWRDGVEIKNILLTQDDDKNPKIAGVIDKEGNVSCILQADIRLIIFTIKIHQCALKNLL